LWRAWTESSPWRRRCETPRDIEAIGGRTKKETGVPTRPIGFGGACVPPGDLVFGDTKCPAVIGQDFAEAVCMPALKRRENERIMIENLGKGKTTEEFAGPGASKVAG
jgi:regulator of RNase E activity RraA